MIYVIFNYSNMINEWLEKYELVRGRINHILSFIYGNNAIIYKNGTRRKYYYCGRNIEYYRIQRILIDKNYLDVFPLITLPGSMVPISDYLIYQDRIPKMIDRYRSTRFEKWCKDNKLDFITLEGFKIIKKSSRGILYSSIDKIIPYSSGKRISYQKNDKSYVYLIRPY